MNLKVVFWAIVTLLNLSSLINAALSHDSVLWVAFLVVTTLLSGLFLKAALDEGDKQKPNRWGVKK